MLFLLLCLLLCKVLYILRSVHWQLKYQCVSHGLFDDIYIIFSMHVKFSIRSRYVLKAITHRKKQWIVLRYLRKSFFQKDTFYIVHSCWAWIIFPFYHSLFLFFIFLISCSIHVVPSQYFCKEFSFKQFFFIILNIWKNLLFF